MERLLLSAGEAEEPAGEGPRRLAMALGLAVAPTSLLGGGAGASGAGASGAGAGASVAPPALLGSALGAKWLAVAGAVVVTGAVAFVTSRSGEPEPRGEKPSTVETRHAAAAAQAQEASPEPAPNEPADERVIEAPALERQRPAAAAPPGRRTEPDGARSIAGEIRQLDAARRSLAGGDPAGALTAIDAYRRANPAGVLRQEATLLRIEALARSGNRSAAREAARRFLRNNPSTPHENRIVALVGDVR
jgi:hypothetical protein